MHDKNHDTTIDSQQQSLRQDFCAQGTCVGTRLPDDESCVNQDEKENLLKKWRKRLVQYRQSFDELYHDVETWEPFDIVVLLTGANDLKSTFFPFLLAEDERDDSLRESAVADAPQVESGLIGDLKLFVSTITEKMKRGWMKTVENIKASAAEFSESLQFYFMDEEEETNERQDWEEAIHHVEETKPATANNDLPLRPREKQKQSHGLELSGAEVSPLFVLPAMPIRSSPAFGQAPMSWLARPIFDSLNDKKRAYAKTQDQVIFVEEPNKSEIYAFGQQRGQMWQQKQAERISLSVQSILPEECQEIVTSMRDFYSSKPASATNFFSPDTIHPTEEGYDVWGKLRSHKRPSISQLTLPSTNSLHLEPLPGRHIGLAITKKLESTSQSYIQSDKQLTISEESKITAPKLKREKGWKGRRLIGFYQNFEPKTNNHAVLGY